MSPHLYSTTSLRSARTLETLLGRIWRVARSWIREVVSQGSISLELISFALNRGYVKTLDRSSGQMSLLILNGPRDPRPPSIRRTGVHIERTRPVATRSRMITRQINSFSGFLKTEES